MSLQRDVGNNVVSRMLTGPQDGGGGPAAPAPAWEAPLGLGRREDRAGAYRALDDLRERVEGTDLGEAAAAVLATLGMGRGPLLAAEVAQLDALGERIAAALEG